MSKRLWNYLRSRVRVVNSNGEIVNGLVIDFVDEMDNGEQDEIVIRVDRKNLDDPTEVSLLESEIVSINELN
ncbi:hypothetical protein [Streptococcus marmotae]|uniref:hypothetical protein n=1 Tax=Streptococcus marmotae TaxID=1825069 RepID=UPI00082C0830|nr:hypothetical protein [Streptococcus marmotae]QBX16916.1 hypothetical protein Javan291_0040 [Streptococcus phage Javan291]